MNEIRAFSAYSPAPAPALAVQIQPPLPKLGTQEAPKIGAFLLFMQRYRRSTNLLRYDTVYDTIPSVRLKHNKRNKGRNNALQE